MKSKSNMLCFGSIAIGVILFIIGGSVSFGGDFYTEAYKGIYYGTGGVCIAIGLVGLAIVGILTKDEQPVAPVQPVAPIQPATAGQLPQGAKLEPLQPAQAQTRPAAPVQQAVPVQPAAPVQQATPVQPAAPVQQAAIDNKVKQLDELLANGVITKDEYEALKSKM